MKFLAVTNAYSGKVIRMNPQFIVRYCELSEDSEHRAKGANTVMVISEGEMPEYFYLRETPQTVDYHLETFARI